VGTLILTGIIDVLLVPYIFYFYYYLFLLDMVSPPLGRSNPKMGRKSEREDEGLPYLLLCLPKKSGVTRIVNVFRTFIT